LPSHLQGGDFDDFVVHQVETLGVVWPLRLSKKMGARLAALDVEIRWLTTWSWDAVKVAQIIGLPTDLPVVAEYGVSSPLRWKWQAVQRFLSEEPGRPYIWIDDDALVEVRTATNHLHIEPNPTKGITFDDFKQIDEFLMRLP
jgi:hypothetical protein